VGQDNDIARILGINVGKIRILSIVISTVLSCYGQIIFVQNIGTMNTYNSHTQVGVFAAAALLVGGASVDSAGISNVFAGIFLFYLMFILSPRAGKELMGKAQIGEYFRIFVSYGAIALSLSFYAWEKRFNMESKRKEIMNLKQRSFLSNDKKGGSKF